MSVQVDLRGDLLTDYAARLQRLNYAPSTISSYTTCVRRLFQTYPGVQPEQMTAEHIERFLDGRRLSPATFSTQTENLRAFFTWLQKHKNLIRVNPCAAVEKPRAPERHRPAPTRAEFDRVCTMCTTAEETCLVEILYFAGLRISELRLARVEDFDLEKRRLRVIGKGNRERMVVYPERVAETVRSLLGSPRTRTYLFSGRQGRPRDAKRFQGLLVALGKKAQLPYHLTAHILRHGYFRLLKTHNVPVEVAARLGGHRDIRTTVQVYGRLDDDDLQAAYDRALQAGA